ALKWPNDVLIDRKKIAGILVEGERNSVVIGIGVNCVSHPTETEFPATDLVAAGVPASPESVFEPLSAAMMRRLGQWERGAGFSAVRADWLVHAAGVGKTIRVKSGDAELT